MSQVVSSDHCLCSAFPAPINPGTRFAIHPSCQAAEVSHELSLLESFPITEHPGSAHVRKDSQKRGHGKARIDRFMGENPAPWSSVRLHDLGFLTRVFAMSSSKVLKQILERQKGIADVRLRPIERHAPHRRDNDISRVQIKMA